MPRATHRKLWAAFVAGTIGLVCQFLPSGCVDYGVTQAVTAFDICSVVNCSGGQFFDFCNPVPLFADCPNATTDGDG